MITKIVEVIALILDNLNKDYSFDEVNKLLDNKDYDRQTVSAAYSLLFDKVLNSKISKLNKSNYKHKAFRVLSNEEIDLIGLENYNYILNLMNIGLIDDTDIEFILEHASNLNGRLISKDDINWIVFISLVDLNAGLLPGSRVLLYSSDTIN
jgi:uncharacterized protein Smg (DUF494 family)